MHAQLMNARNHASGPLERADGMKLEESGNEESDNTQKKELIWMPIEINPAARLCCNPFNAFTLQFA
jgi:hypothetical protein